MKTGQFLGYTVYEDGRIWRPSRVRVSGLCSAYKAGWVATRIRKTDKGHGGGYEFVDLWDATTGKKKTWLVHRVVALTFLPTSDTALDVNHKDGVRHHNHVNNLEWLSRSDNQKHAYRTGVRTDIGENRPNSKMSNVAAASIPGLRAQGLSLNEISARVGINFRNVSAVLKGRHSVTRGLVPTPDQRIKIVDRAALLRDLKEGVLNKDVCKKYGLSRSTVWKLCKKEHYYE